mgnify:CR=1 FL=1
MKKNRKNLLVIISILGILFSTGCQRQGICRSYYAAVENSIMKIGEKQPLILDKTCNSNVYVYVSIQNKDILRYDYETHLLEALKFGNSTVIVIFGSHDGQDLFTVYVTE